MDVAVVVGNPNRGGRTTSVAEAVADRIMSEIAGNHAATTFELSDIAGELFEWEAPAPERVNEAVGRSDVAIFACPTYKASFTGLLKAFLDRYGGEGLAGVVAVPVMLGASPRHQLAVETQLRPVLVELAASIPTRGLFVVDTELDRLDETIDSWWRLASGPLTRAVSR
jgi:FMN reductase